MRCFNTDHPHLRSPPGCLSAGELRHWFQELAENPEHGWTHNRACLARTIGFSEPAARASFTAKYKYGSWIYPGEQIRFSRGLKRILSGELVMRLVDRRWQAVQAEHPMPLKGTTRLRYNLGRGGLEWARVAIAPSPLLPSFKQLMSHAPLGHSMRQK